MKRHTSMSARGSAQLAVATLAAFSLLVVAASTAQAAVADVPLGTAGTFVVLADTAITNTGPTTLNGDIGNGPSAASSPGYGGALTINGTDHAGDGVTLGAKGDLTAAYLVAAGETPVTGTISADLAGQTLPPGIYDEGSTMNITGPTALVLDAGGDPNAIWVFQAGSDLVVGSDTTVSLRNGAQVCHVYWQVTSSASLGTNAHFIGTILALTSITLDTGATIQGRALARNGDVTMDSNTITRVPCAAAPSGGVGTGDGSTSQGGANNTLYLLGGAVVLAVLASAVIVADRRRRNVSI